MKNRVRKISKVGGAICVIIFILILVLLDISTKLYARSHDIGVLNIGISFGLFSNVSNTALTGMNVLLALALGLLIKEDLSVVLLNYSKGASIRITALRLIGYVFLTGGAFGNILSRLLWSGVWDWIEISTFPSFNLADVMINLGIVILLVSFVYGWINTEEN